MNRNVLVAIFGVLLAASLGVNGWQYFKTSKSGSENKELAQITLLNDSLKNELKRMEDSLKPLLSNYQEENSRLTGKIEELEQKKGAAPVYQSSSPEKDAIIAQLQQRIAALQAQSAKAGEVTKNVTEKVAKGEKPTKKDMEELAKIREELAASKKEVEELKAQLALVTSQRDAFEAQVRDEQAASADMKDRISRGALPQYGTLISSGIAKKGDQQVETFKTKGVEKLKISFDVLDNPLIREPVEEEVTIRIIGPEGEVLCSNPSLSDKSKLFSLKQTIISDGEMHKVKWYYPPTGTIGKLKKGKYTTELWARGLLKQKNTFELN